MNSSDPLSIAPHRPGCTADSHGRRAVIVTGAAKRLGRAIALHLAGQGWDVIVHFHRSAGEADATVADIQALGRRAIALGADLADEPAVDALFDAAITQLPVRAVVNSASHFEHDAPASFSAARLLQHLGPNLAGPVRLAQRLHGA